MSKLETLAELAGQSIEELLQEATFDSVAQGICVNEDCDYTTEVEPDQNKGFCEICQTNTVQSVLILACMI